MTKCDRDDRAFEGWILGVGHGSGARKKSALRGVFERNLGLFGGGLTEIGTEK